MKYISTRGGISPISFSDAIMMGLATDGGLIIPEKIPDVTDKLGSWSALAYPDLAREILSIFVGDDIPPEDLTRIVQTSYATFSHPETVPLVDIGDIHILELFHGPSLAFKDIALQFLGNLFEYILDHRHGHLNILGATSGDTGSAAIYGVRGKKNMKIFILHPFQRVSPVQERQMTTVLDENVFNIAIEGSFDDGQRIIKSIFNDLDFKDQYHLGAVNSVNWARVAAQVVYYFYAALRVTATTSTEKVRVCVPTGNFGNVFAGYIALKMGAPISKLILATNENQILSRFFNSGVYRRDEVYATISPSMDIQVASNFERYLYYRVGENAPTLTSMMEMFADTGELKLTNCTGTTGIDDQFIAGSSNTAETLQTIRSLFNDSGYLSDPHTAVGISVARKHLKKDEPTVCLATAHPAKFDGAIERALGKNEAHHPSIDKLKTLPTRCVVLPATEEAIREHMVYNI